MVCQTPLAVISLQEEKGGMWIVGEWLSAMATCMRVILILLLYVFVVEQYLISLRNNTPH